MSYRRSIVTRATLLTRRLSLSPPLSHSLSSDNDKNKPRQYPPPIFPVNSPLYFFPVNPFAYRSLSTGSGDKAEYFADVADVLSGSGDVAGPVMSEVAVAAADSAFPVAALQYLIEGVHNVTGFNWRVAIYVRVAEPWFFLDVFTKRINLGYICFAIIGMLKSYLIEGGHNFTVFYWWASIALTTLLIRGATVPLLISTLKASTKLGLLRPELEEIKNEMQDKGMDPQAVADGQKRMQALFNQYGVTPFTPLKGLLIQGPVFLSFFLAISNMVEKVPSFKRGGAFWFTDLTTPDTLYIFPVLTALSFWITVEFNTQEGMEGNPAAKTMKKVSRIFAAVTIPITMNFPKALFCYWVTSNLFSLMYGVVLKAPGVKQFLNIPEIPVAPPSSNTDSGKPEFSFLESMKKYVAAQKHIHEQQTAEILSQRVKGLESQVKAKNKNKKT